jgi:hypothetical protein
MVLGIAVESIGKSKSFKNLALISFLSGKLFELFWDWQLKLTIVTINIKNKELIFFIIGIEKLVNSILRLKSNFKTKKD